MGLTRLAQIDIEQAADAEDEGCPDCLVRVDPHVQSNGAEVMAWNALP